MIFRKLKFSDVQMPETSGPEAALWQMRAENSKVRENPAERIVLHILPLVDSGGPWRPGPPLPPKFVQNHAVSGIFKRKPLIKFWAQAPTWVKTLLGPTWPKSWIHPCLQCPFCINFSTSSYPVPEANAEMWVSLDSCHLLRWTFTQSSHKEQPWIWNTSGRK